jgi:hypothetical protein
MFFIRATLVTHYYSATTHLQSVLCHILTPPQSYRDFDRSLCENERVAKKRKEDQLVDQKSKQPKITDISIYSFFKANTMLIQLAGKKLIHDVIIGQSLK